MPKCGEAHWGLKLADPSNAVFLGWGRVMSTQGIQEKDHKLRGSKTSLRLLCPQQSRAAIESLLGVVCHRCLSR